MMRLEGSLSTFRAGELIAAGLIGLALGLVAVMAWLHRVKLIEQMHRAPPWLWTSVLGGLTLATLLFFRRAAPAPDAAPTIPTPPPPERPPDHATDLPLDTIPDRSAPLVPPDGDDADVLRWLEQRASARADPTE